jgi:hypothetical protein
MVYSLKKQLLIVMARGASEAQQDVAIQFFLDHPSHCVAS